MMESPEPTQPKRICACSCAARRLSTTASHHFFFLLLLLCGSSSLTTPILARPFLSHRYLQSSTASPSAVSAAPSVISASRTSSLPDTPPLFSVDSPTAAVPSSSSVDPTATIRPPSVLSSLAGNVNGDDVQKLILDLISASQELREQQEGETNVEAAEPERLKEHLWAEAAELSGVLLKEGAKVVAATAEKAAANEAVAKEEAEETATGGEEMGSSSAMGLAVEEEVLAPPSGVFAELEKDGISVETGSNDRAAMSPGTLTQEEAEEDDEVGESLMSGRINNSVSGVLLSGMKYVEGVTIDDSTVKDLMESVLRIHVIRAIPDFGMPWTIKGEARATGSGFPIAGRKIITNAHVVTYAHILRVERPGSPKLFDARIISTAHEPDLCVLTVDDDSFWEGLKPLEFAEGFGEELSSTVPNILDGVYVVGYPTGGESLSVTQGIMSRVEVGIYSHSAARLLEIQIDAAINPGNSGGPVVNTEGKCVGVAFQGLSRASSIGYIIPIPIVNHILQDIELHGKYTGIVSLGVLVQSLRNPILRDYLGMSDLDETTLPEGVMADGVVITDVDERRVEAFRAENPKMTNLGLMAGDVLLALNGKNVAEDGSIRFRNVERVAMNYLLTGKYANDLIPATVLRERVVMEVQVPLAVPEYLVPAHTKDVKPKYVFFGGCVFVSLTKQYILDFTEARNRLALSTKISSYQSQFQTDELQEIVIISRILASSMTKGYNIQNQQVASINGVKVKNLAHLAELVGITAPNRSRESELQNMLEMLANAQAVPTVDSASSSSSSSASSLIPEGEAVKAVEGVETAGSSSLDTAEAATPPTASSRSEAVPVPEYLKFNFVGDNFNFVMDKQLALESNAELLAFHRIDLPLYIED